MVKFISVSLPEMPDHSTIALNFKTHPSQKQVRCAWVPWVFKCVCSKTRIWIRYLVRLLFRFCNCTSFHFCKYDWFSFA